MTDSADRLVTRYNPPRRGGRHRGGSAMPEFTIDEVIEQYVRSGCSEKTPNTLKADAQCYSQILKKLKGYWLTYDTESKRRKVLTGAVVRWYREARKAERTRRGGGTSPLTIQRELAVASAAVKWCISEEDWDIPNPFEGRLISKKDRKALRAVAVEITAEQERLLLLAAPQPLQDMIAFALDTGMRSDELRKLTWDRINGRIIVFAPGDHKSQTWAQSAMSEAGRAILDRQPRYEGCPWVFTDPETRTLLTENRMSYIWKVTRARAGVKCRKHDLRHTFARRARARGVSPDDIQAQLRHSDRQTTEVYAVPGIESIMRAVGR